MAIPKEPRALMIQLMYLVLTAMLALNITREVLNAFTTINDSMNKSNTTISSSNESIYKSLEAKVADKEIGEMARPFYDKALIVKSKAEEMYNFLESLKDTVVNRSGGYVKNEVTGLMEISKKEDINASTEYFVKLKKGDEVKSKLEAYIQDLIASVDDPQTKEYIKTQIPLNLADFPKSEENPSGDWTFGNFNNMPTIGTVTLLSKYQNDIKNAEGVVAKYLHDQVGADRIRIDEFIAIAVPNTNYALPGEEITSTITLAAYNKAVNPVILSNRGAVQVKEGVGTLKFRAPNANGKFTVTGNISMPVGGANKSYPYKFDIMVGSTGASMQLEAMNVVYIGVDNPARVSASGYDIKDVDLRIPGAKITKKTDGEFVINVNDVKPTNALPFTVVAKNKDGKVEEVQKGNLRVKTIPTPIAKLGGKSSGAIETHVAKAQQGPIAELENFIMDGIKFTIVSYNFVYVPKGGLAVPQTNSGARFNSSINDLKERSKPGDSWYIEDIKAKGPDGRTRDLPTISLKLI